MIQIRYEGIFYFTQYLAIPSHEPNTVARINSILAEGAQFSPTEHHNKILITNKNTTSSCLTLQP